MSIGKRILNSTLERGSGDQENMESNCKLQKHEAVDAAYEAKYWVLQ